MEYPVYLFQPFLCCTSKLNFGCHSIMKGLIRWFKDTLSLTASRPSHGCGMHHGSGDFYLD